MKILGFNASPRIKGNTAWVINKILESAKEQGAETQIWHFSNLDINPCKGCLACKKTGTCAVDDNMQKIYNEIESADAIVLGSPVYMGQMTAQSKIFTDRLFAQISPRFSPHYKEKEVQKKLLLVFTQGNPDVQFFRDYYDYTKRMFNMLEFDTQEVCVVAGTRTENAHEKKELYNVLENIGASLALG